MQAITRPTTTTAQNRLAFTLEIVRRLNVRARTAAEGKLALVADDDGQPDGKELSQLPAFQDTSAINVVEQVGAALQQTANV